MKTRLLLIALSVVLVAVFSAMPLLAQPEEEEEEPIQTRPNPVEKLTLPGSAKMIIIITGKTGKSSKAEVVGNKLYLIGADGKKSLAEDGTYNTKDGKTMRVKGGIMHPGSIRGFNPQPEPPAMEYDPKSQQIK